MQVLVPPGEAVPVPLPWKSTTLPWSNVPRPLTLTLKPRQRPVRKQGMSTTIKIRGSQPHGQEALCRTCRWVHMQKGFRDSEEAIYCDYGTLRPLRFKVAECTDYMDRTAPSRAEMEGMALLINISPARPNAGFTRALAGFWPGEEEEETEECPAKRE
jgi:hypothetical protein